VSSEPVHAEVDPPFSGHAGGGKQCKAGRGACRYFGPVNQRMPDVAAGLRACWNSMTNPQTMQGTAGRDVCRYA
jgi:hypothetical protein